jgi:hypothetical protein
LISTSPDDKQLTFDIAEEKVSMVAGPSKYKQRKQIKQDLQPFNSTPLCNEDNKVIGKAVDVEVVIANEVLVRHEESRLLIKTDSEFGESYLVCSQ